MTQAVQFNDVINQQLEQSAQFNDVINQPFEPYVQSNDAVNQEFEQSVQYNDVINQPLGNHVQFDDVISQRFEKFHEVKHTKLQMPFNSSSLISHFINRSVLCHMNNAIYFTLLLLKRLFMK